MKFPHDGHELYLRIYGLVMASTPIRELPSWAKAVHYAIIALAAHDAANKHPIRKEAEVISELEELFGGPLEKEVLSKN